jgi:hypothetical protein
VNEGCRQGHTTAEDAKATRARRVASRGVAIEVASASSLATTAPNNTFKLHQQARRHLPQKLSTHPPDVFEAIGLIGLDRLGCGTR